MLFAPNDIPDEAITALSPAFDDCYVSTSEEWVQKCKEDLAQLWFHAGYWIISQVLIGKKGRVLHVVASAGKYNDALIEEVKAWGKSVGCCLVFSEVRPGIARRRKNCRVKRWQMEEDLI